MSHIFSLLIHALPLGTVAGAATPGVRE